MGKGLSMLRKIVKADNNKQKREKMDPVLATAAVLLKMVAVDGKTERIEMLHLGEILRKEFKVDDNGIQSILNVVAREGLLMDNIKSLTEEINANWGNAKRIQLLTYLWILAFSNDDLNEFEADMLEETADLLCLNDAERYKAQEAAEIHLGMHENF